MAKPKRTTNEFLHSTLGIERRVWVFFFGLLFVGTLATLLYEVIHDYPSIATEAGKTCALIRGTILVVVTFLAAWVAYLVYRRKEKVAFELLLRQFAPIRETHERKLTRSYRGLIWLLSPANPELIEFPIIRHKHGLEEDRKGGKLEVCWCIIPQEEPLKEKAEEEFNRICQWVKKQGSDIIMKPIWIDYPEVPDTFHAVNRIYEEGISLINRDLERQGKSPLEPKDVISDITSGLRSMSAGMLLACLEQKRPVEYVKSDYNDKGDPIPDTRRLTIIDTSLAWSKITPKS